MLELAKFPIHERHVYIIVLELNSGVDLYLCEYVMFMLTHLINARAGRAGIAGKLYCLGKPVL
jgi:hypothetical protein